MAAALLSPLATGQSPDNTVWTEILQTYVATSPDGMTRFDYSTMQRSEPDRAKLETYIESFADLDFDKLSRDAQFAAWANLYNAVMVDYVIGKYPTDTIKPWYSSGPWKKITVRAGGRDVSLDEIEHDILRKRWDEPRVHYAINCASYSCPNLRAQAWSAEGLDEALDVAAHNYINHPRGVTVQKDGDLEVSSIYKWFREDFGGNEAGVIAHLKKYADGDLAKKIAASKGIDDYEYDWSLNDTES